MSISAAFNASRSGLTAAARWAEVTSSNIANASQPGYARRSILRTTGQTGEVLVTGLQREVDATLDRMYRQGLSGAARQQTIADGLSAYAGWLGDTDNPGGLLARLTALQTSFDQLGNSPGDTVLQRNALEAAQSLTLTLNRADATLAAAMTDAQTGIRNDVARLNQSLAEIAELNVAIYKEPEGTARRAGLEDQLGSRLDQLAEIADIAIRRDAHGRVSIATGGGAPLLEGSLVHEVVYDPGTGTLSADGVDITPGVPGARGANEGTLAGQMVLLRQTLPLMRLQLDEFARAMIEGFEAADASLAPGQAGLFTEAGGAFSGTTAGLAGRIGINAAARPELGGALWRLRDGLGAATEGTAGDNAQVLGFLAVLDGTHAFAPAAGQGASRGLRAYLSGVVSAQQNVRVAAQEKHEGLIVNLTAIETSRQSVQGVNIDDELQQLADIEQAYNANSQVLRTLSEMLDSLLAAV
jgi:flagellar hook-associated protein 1 FlgK